jgi:hypothetical protein
MKIQSRILVLGVATLLIHSSLALAAEESTSSKMLDASEVPGQEAGVSSVNANVNATSSILDNLYADYFGTYHGPVLNNLNSPYSVNNRGQVTGKNVMYFDSELTTAFLIDKDSGIGIGPDVPFQAAPVLGQGLTMGDVGIKAFDKKTVDSGNFRLYTNLYVQAPTSLYSSQVVNMKYAVKTTPYWWYHLQNTRFTVGAWTEAKTYQGVTSDKTFKLYAEPYANYQITPKLSANLAYEMEAHHIVNTPALDFSSYETDMQPGFVYAITHTVIVNPYIQLFTGNKITSDTMAFGAVISAQLL